MVAISSTAFSRFFICSLLSVSVVSASIPVISYETRVEKKAIFFEQRILSLLGKIFKYAKKKEAKKATSKLMEMKEEMENYYNTHLSFSDAIDEIQRNLVGYGTPLTKNQLKNAKKFFRDKWKHRKSRSCDFLGDENEQIRNERGEPISIDLELQIGITAACAGLFLAFIPIPICTVVGTDLLQFGLGVIVAHTMSEMKNPKNNLLSLKSPEIFQLTGSHIREIPRLIYAFNRS